jgi:hypothetical protein
LWQGGEEYTFLMHGSKVQDISVSPGEQAWKSFRIGGA